MGTADGATHVFGYGSLLDLRSLHHTLPEIDPQHCIPATAEGLVRCFDVAFPNDGSQGDKAYYAADGHRPPRILLANLRPEPGRRVNGICIPVRSAELAALRERERRYTEHDVTVRIAPYSGQPVPTGRVLAFLGRPEFTRREDVDRGVLSAAYRDTILAGADYWEGRLPGFAVDFHAATRLPAPERVRLVRRVDLGAT